MIWRMAILTRSGDKRYHYDVGVPLLQAVSECQEASLASPSAVNSGPNCSIEPKRGHVLRVMRWAILVNVP